jgi:predicted PurR-regulated permease PerM
MPDLQIDNTPADRIRRKRPRSRWGLLLPVSLGIFLALFALAVLWLFARAFAVLILSVTIADALGPLARRLEKRMRRPVAVSLIYVGLLAIALLAIGAIGPSMARQGQEVADRAPEIVDQVRQIANRWLNVVPGSAATALPNLAQGFISKLASLPLVFGSGLITALIIVFLSFYWLIAEPQINGFLRSLFPPEKRKKADEVREKMSRAMGGYVRGVCLTSLAVGSLTWIGLTLVGVPFALPLALVATVAEFIPYVGPVIAAVPGIAVAFLDSPHKALWALGVYVAVQQAEGHLLSPNILRRETDVPQALVIFALLAGGAVGGVLGAVVAVPVAGALKVLVEEVFAPMIRRWSGAESNVARE